MCAEDRRAAACACRRTPINRDFHYTHSELALLSDEQRERLFKGAKILLDVALDFALHGLEESSLYAAEVLFHKAAGGVKPKPDLGPEAFKAKNDAVRMEVLIDLANVKRPSREESLKLMEDMIAALEKRKGKGDRSWTI